MTTRSMYNGYPLAGHCISDSLTEGSRCMRRLQGNLSYLAALADRKGAQLPPCPAHLMAPSLNQSIKMRSQPSTQSDSSEKQLDPNADREERENFLKEMYQKLQALFPGIDPRREPAFQTRGGQGQPPNQSGPRPAGAQASNQGSPAPAAAQALRAAQAAAQAAAQPGNLAGHAALGSS